MQSIENKILSQVHGRGRGWAFSGSDFLEQFDKANTDKALSSLSSQKKIRRVMRGIYDYPRYSKLLNSELSPDLDQVANALARKANWRIQPTGETALNILELSTQVPGKFLFLSDGPSRKYKIGKQTLEFKQTVLKEIGYKQPESGLIVQAVKALGKDRMTNEIIQKISERLNENQKRKIRKETKTATGWVYDYIKQICSLEY